MRLRIGLGLALIAVAGSAPAEEVWVGFSNDTPFAEARIEVGKTGTEVVEFDLVIPGVSLERLATETGDFTRLEIPGLGRVGRAGEPMLPALRRFIEIPVGATAEVAATVLDRETVELATEDLPALVYPVQLPMPKCDCPEADDWRFSFDPKAYQGTIDRGTPELSGPFGLRDHRMMVVTASPVTYDVAAGSIEVATRLRVTVTITGGDSAATVRLKERLSSRHYDAFLTQAALNLNLTEAGGWAYPDDAPVEFLIITPPQFIVDLAPFVEWKTSTGYDVSVVTTDVTGTSTTAIKSYITGQYNGAEPPVYILMIGDSPSPLATYVFGSGHGGQGGSDLPFVQMDGDLYPDLMIARWPIDDTTELANMRDKILHYEHPTAANSAWLNRALYLGGSGYEPSWTTHEEVVDQLMEPAPNSAECDVWLDSESPTTNELIADLNTGRAWMVYSAHCGPDGMVGDPPFRDTHVPNLANADQYPIGIGHCCQSNMWATNGDVFGEVTVIQPNKGFVSYWGGSNSTYWDEDDWLEKGFFDALIEADMAGNIGDWDGLYSNLAACYAGLSEVTMRGTSREDYYWHMYNLNGDPTLDPFTRQPISMTVGAPPVVPPVADSFTVTVNDDVSGPVSLAMVGVTQNSTLLGAGLTDATGVATFPIDAPSPGSDLLVRVTAHNHLPTDATTMVAAGSDGVVVLDGTIYRCDSVVTIDVFDEDLVGAPPFDVLLSTSPSGNSTTVQVQSVGGGIIQYRGWAELGTHLAAAHGDVLTVTYNDADTGFGSSGVKTDTAVLDCAGPVISDLELVELGANTVTVRWTTDEPASSSAVIYPDNTTITDAGLVIDHELVFDGLAACTEYTMQVASWDALGNASYAGPTPPFETWMQTIAFDDDVESGQGAWIVHTAVDPPGSGVNWSIVTDAQTSSPAHSWFTADENVPKDDRLEAGPFTLGGGSPVLSFWHHFATESGYDGGVLEVSTDGITWDDVEDAGGVFLAGGYNDSVSSSSNPLTNGQSRAFWAGSGSLQQVQVDLSALAGGDLWVRFRFGCDGSVASTGWWVDDVKIETTAPCDMLFGDGFEIGSCGNWSSVLGEQ